MVPASTDLGIPHPGAAMKLLTLLSLMPCLLFGGNNSLSGVARDLNGVAVPGATIYVSDSLGTLVSVSDLSGKYNFTELPDGNYSVQAWAGEHESCTERISLKGGIHKFQDAELSTKPAEVPVTLKITSMFGLARTQTIQLQLPLESVQGSPFQSERLRSALAAYVPGEYEVILSKPGSVFVGTCLIYPGHAAENLVLQTNGMEISGEDYVHALALHSPTIMGSLGKF